VFNICINEYLQLVRMIGLYQELSLAVKSQKVTWYSSRSTFYSL